MSASQMMPGPDGTDVRAYRRSRLQVTTGDYLPDYGAHIVCPSVTDPDTGSVWVTLDDGRDVELRTRKVWTYRRYTAPDWMRDALEAYKGARDAREAMRESGAPAPSSVPGIAGSQVAWCQLERADFDAAYPAPRLADYIRDAAAAWREGREQVSA